MSANLNDLEQTIGFDRYVLSRASASTTEMKECPTTDDRPWLPKYETAADGRHFEVFYLSDPYRIFPRITIMAIGTTSKLTAIMLGAPGGRFTQTECGAAKLAISGGIVGTAAPSHIQLFLICGHQRCAFALSSNATMAIITGVVIIRE